MQNSIKIIIPPKTEYISAVRYSAGLFANQMGFDIESIEDIKLVVGEACNNAVLYGNPDNNTVEVNFSEENNSLLIEVIDNGFGFDVEKYNEPDINEICSGGLGIYIMKSLSTSLEFVKKENIGTVLKIKFDL